MQKIIKSVQAVSIMWTLVLKSVYTTLGFLVEEDPLTRDNNVQNHNHPPSRRYDRNQQLVTVDTTE